MCVLITDGEETSANVQKQNNISQLVESESEEKDKSDLEGSGLLLVGAVKSVKNES